MAITSETPAATTQPSHSFSAYVKNRVKGVLRPLIPAHKRFVKAGEHFLLGGEREVHELPKLVRPGTVAFDVGAHIGDYTYSLCKQVGEKGRVIAIEPLPHLAKMLTRATTTLQLPVTVLHCALSSKPGQATLRVPIENGEDKNGFATLVPRIEGGKSFTVQLRTLDEIAETMVDKQGDAISFMKIDVEGHELDVLRGAEKTIRKHRPNLLIEIEQRHSAIPIAETFEYVKSLGYSGEFLEADRTYVPLANFSIETHQTSRLGQKSYISNFIFKPL